MTAGALRRFLDAYSVVPDLPVALSLRSFARVFGPRLGAATAAAAGAGWRPAAQALARAVLTQLAVFHAPDELLVAVCAGPERRAALGVGQVAAARPPPHPHRRARPGPAGHQLRRRTGTAARRGAGQPLPVQPGRPGHRRPARGGGARRRRPDRGHRPDRRRRHRRGHRPRPGHPAAPPARPVRAAAGPARPAGCTPGRPRGTPRWAPPTSSSPADAEAVARRLAPLRLAGTARGPDAPLRAELGLPELLGLGDPESFTAEQGWAPRAPRDRLRVPIGVGADGGAIELDLKESAQDGMGPHGLLIGATGSGKSELLRTLVLGLAATHSSEQLNFVLVDFKGGATFASFDRLPHTAAVITNLADALPLVDRMVDAINGELVRRQELLRRAGNFASVRDYERARAAGTPLAPLPSLLLICDEFSELLSAKPDFIDLFVQIGRLGRSLGVHLLLASQRLEEGRLRGLDTHLSYRIGLRTFSALESRTVLGVPDAHELPRSPGHGYLRAGTDPLVRFKAAYVSGAVRRRGGPAGAAGAGAPAPAHLLHPPGAGAGAGHPGRAARRRGGRPRETLLDLLVGRLAGQGPPGAPGVAARRSDRPPALDELLGPVEVDPARGLTVGNPELHGALQVPVAVVDKPFEQRRDLFWLALDGAAGHVAVVGAPQSGKSTVLRTLICALALTHTPAEVQVYCLDFGGGGLGRAARPAARRRGGRPRRPDRGPAYRRRDRHPARRAGAALRRAGRGVDGRVAAAPGRVGAGRPAGRRPVRRRVPGGRRLGHPARRVRRPGAAGHRPGHPGPVVRACTWWPRAVRWTGLPAGDPGPVRLPAGAAPRRPGGLGWWPAGRRRTCRSSPAGASPPRGCTSSPRCRSSPALGGDTADLVKAGRRGLGRAGRAPGAAAPAGAAVRRAGPRRDHRAAPCRSGSPRRTCARWCWTSPPSRTSWSSATRSAASPSFLRALATSIITRFTPEQARVILVDYRRSLLGTIETPHLIGYGTAAAHTAELVESAAGYLQGRLPGPEVTPPQLRGPVLVVRAGAVRAGRRLRPGRRRSGEPAARAGGAPAARPRRRAAPGAGPPLRRRGPGPVRADRAAAAGALHRRAGDGGQPGGGRAGRSGPARAAATGAGSAGHPAGGRTAGPAGPPAAPVNRRPRFAP